MRNAFSQNMAALDASANQNGATLDASSVLAASAVAVVTGTSTGTLSFQVSNDLPSKCTVDSAGKLQPVNWINAGTAMQVAIAGAAVYLIPKFDCAYQWLRCQYLKTNGAAGTITVNINTKGF